MKEKSTEARKKIGLQLLERREKLGLTQEDLAKILEINQTTVAKVERGRWSFSIDYLEKFCDVLGLNIQLYED